MPKRLQPHITTAIEYCVFNPELRINGGKQLSDALHLMYRSRQEEWELEDLPSARTCQREINRLLPDPKLRHFKADSLMQRFDYTTCIGDEGHLISLNDARTAMDFYWLYVSEATRNFRTYPEKFPEGFDTIGWQPTLGLIKSCVLTSHLQPEVAIYGQAQSGEREWLRQLVNNARGYKGRLTSDYDQLYFGSRSWNYPENAPEKQEFNDVITTLEPNLQWDLTGDDDFKKLLRKTSIDQLPLWRYSRLTNRQSYHDYMTLQVEAEIRAQEQALKTVDYYIPPQHRDPDTGRLVTSRPPDFVESGIDSSIGINEIRELLPNLNREQRLALANEIWNEV